MKHAAIGAAALLLAACASPRPQIAITIDDLPVHAPYPPGVTPDSAAEQMIAALKVGSVPATGFVNAVRLREDPASRRVLDRWRAAELGLGNHGWAHRSLSQMSIDEFTLDLVRGEPVLKELSTGTDWRWFRYPFLDEGRDKAQRVAARQVLASRGYRVAAVTMSFADWAWTPAYARCGGKEDAAGIATLERLYLAALAQSIADDRETARKLYGRDIPYVLLMHVSAMSAHMMAQVIRAYRDAGFRFVSLDEAERDPAYRAYTDLSLPPPPSRAEMAKRRNVMLSAPPDYSERLDKICA